MGEREEGAGRGSGREEKKVRGKNGATGKFGDG